MASLFAPPADGGASVPIVGPFTRGAAAASATNGASLAGGAGERRTLRKGARKGIGRTIYGSACGGSQARHAPRPLAPGSTPFLVFLTAARDHHAALTSGPFDPKSLAVRLNVTVDVIACSCSC